MEKAMNGQEILQAMKEGHTLHGSRFGFYILNPIDSRCTNVHNGAAKSLVRRKLISRDPDSEEWTIAPDKSATPPKHLLAVAVGKLKEIEELRWGYDGDCGAISLADQAQELIAEAIKQLSTPPNPPAPSKR